MLLSILGILLASTIFVGLMFSFFHWVTKQGDKKYPKTNSLGEFDAKMNYQKMLAYPVIFIAVIAFGFMMHWFKFGTFSNLF